MIIFAQTKQFAETVQLLGAICALVPIIIALVIYIFFLRTLSKCLSRVAPQNRDMVPRMVWLNMWPIINIVWIFVTVTDIRSSLRKEFRDRGLPGENKYFGIGFGIAYTWLFLLGILIPLFRRFLRLSPHNLDLFIVMFFLLAGLTCFVVYWVQIANFSGQIAQPRRPPRWLDDNDELGLARPRLDDPQSGPEGEPDKRYRAK